MPLTFHLYCLHHLNGNVTTNLRAALGSDWDNFTRDFWVAYRAVSPQEFDFLWAKLCTQHPSARRYLDAELYPCRSHWAWAWVSNIFTAGVRTSGRVEGENRVNKSIGGPKKSFLQLFTGLNDRSEEQAANDLIRSLFTGPLTSIREHAGPFAVQTCYTQMQASLFYTTEVVQRPTGVTSWQMFNSFQNDNAYISVRWLIELVIKRGLVVRHLLLVRHESTGTFHYIAVLSDGRYICDCCMPANLGIPCRHYFRIWIDVQNLPFHISLIRPR
ncbi:hypothetical protein C8J57DRAFT_1090006 [Mycena rebaudengoi]|nr:hypothetical protein C8J57DRAFT_1090006 [Mycena rebaudengoi]